MYILVWGQNQNFTLGGFQAACPYSMVKVSQIPGTRILSPLPQVGLYGGSPRARSLLEMHFLWDH